MLNRRILRIKAFKTVYALVEDPALSREEALSQLEESCQATRDLYLFMLALIPALTDAASARIEAARAKFHPTPEELNPNLKFVQNRIAVLLAEDPDFSKLISKKKLSWEAEDAFLWHFYDALKASDAYKAYMDEPSSSLEEDAKLWKSVFETLLEDNEELADIIYEKSAWWNDELGYALLSCCRTLDELGSGKSWTLPELYLSQMDGKTESDRDFVRGIVIRAVADYPEAMERISALTPKWDIGRICATDLALIMTGMAEKAAFPNLDSKIIINEYVEISKFFSTPESKSFVNGLLDKLIGSGAAC